MRRLYVFDMVSLDGFFAGPAGELDWHHVDAEFNEFAVAQLDATDLLAFGRKTYELMASHWTTEEARQRDSEVARRMNATQKLVASTTLQAAPWENTRVVRDPVAALGQEKGRPGKDIGVLGSGRLATALVEAGLVDEVRWMVNPVLLGTGRPPLSLTGRIPLQRPRTREFANGNVLLTYRPTP